MNSLRICYKAGQDTEVLICGVVVGINICVCVWWGVCVCVVGWGVCVSMCVCGGVGCICEYVCVVGCM